MSSTHSWRQANTVPTVGMKPGCFKTGTAVLKLAGLKFLEWSVCLVLAFLVFMSANSFFKALVMLLARDCRLAFVGRAWRIEWMLVS